MKAIIVLETSGKNESVDYVRIKLFESKEEAEAYCIANTDEPKDQRYWNYCEIVEEGAVYEPARYLNYKEN